MKFAKHPILALIVASGYLLAEDGYCAHDSKRFTFDTWIARVGLNYGKEYNAPQFRKKRILENYQKLAIGMNSSVAESLMGSPDVEQISGVKGRCFYDWAFFILKDDTNLVDPHDVAIFLTFDQQRKLKWAVPQNIKGLKQKGSPN